METTPTHPDRLTPDDLDRIRAEIDWRALFAGLGFNRDEGRSTDEDWWAVSPFGQSGGVTFHMRPGGVWYDFARRSGGGPIELVQQLEGGNCFEAARLILERGWCAVPGEPDGQPCNPIIRQDLRDLLGHHDTLAACGLSEETCRDLGMGYLAQGRSPLRHKIVFQVADARVTRKSEGERVRVILSHIGCEADALAANRDYQLYQGFEPSQEFFGQDRLWLDPDAADQIVKTEKIVVTDDPFGLAKAHEAGMRNALASFDASLSQAQCNRIAELAAHHGVTGIVIAYGRQSGTCNHIREAAARLEALDLSVTIFDWKAPVGSGAGGPVHIPDTINDLVDLSTDQLVWLRARGLL